MTTRVRAISGWIALAGALTLLAGCDEPSAVAETAETKEAPAEVSVLTVQPGPRPYIRELPGRIAPTRIAEIRARVAGIVMERTFTQGADVKAGDILYRIDPKPFAVELDVAEAALAKAVPEFENATQQAQRMSRLIGTQAVSQAEYERAITVKRQAEADVAARRADVARAKLNLEYTNVRSPISGRVGKALVTEGAYVGRDEATHLSTVQQLDPIYADFTQSVGELQQLRRELAAGTVEQASADAAKVNLVLDDGTIYRYSGKLLFSDVTVDPSTGQVTLRGEFPNPNHELLPGMYVRVQVVQGIDPDALSVPQQAVRFNDTGNSEVHLVRDDNRTVVQPVRLGRLIDNNWTVEDGLKPSDRVIVEGFQKFAPGDVVRPVPWRTTTAEAAETKDRAREAGAPPQSVTR
ncbi:efflux RND transporter periplasmic adaptor subunit [Pseudolabrys taiwanensis]|uniref:Efflux RND transporter periplasmic adaptor subunit n=1 Tax=Pseudolabrys taiwanensis TaxID=331696 RepID=A0A345ZYJ2_9HYPH|nr:efflux RND transporter periplasmic adaptor subunit [Pseudolabrys taiwanensis]AXK81989.1 efflux RND transporter periplasmic adaptor subunit [Pseudolabrys taiwanensis]